VQPDVEEAKYLSIAETSVEKNFVGGAYCSSDQMEFVGGSWRSCSTHSYIIKRLHF